MKVYGRGCNITLRQQMQVAALQVQYLHASQRGICVGYLYANTQYMLNQKIHLHQVVFWSFTPSGLLIIYSKWSPDHLQKEVSWSYTAAVFNRWYAYHVWYCTRGTPDVSKWYAKK